MSQQAPVDNQQSGDDIAIRVENLSKTFKLPHEKYSSVKSLFVNFYKRKKTYEVQHALRDVSFEIKKGEFFGIVGRNGSGKSTLLKLIAGIYTPTRGRVVINGSLTPFIELGVGFNPELTGRENVYLNGALLGFNRKEMKKMYNEIVEFAELEKFMDQKLKNYSSGMQVRLAFSIAIRAQSSILLLDEVLAVGDAAFQRKCLEYFRYLKDQMRTVVLVTHDMTNIRSLCTRAALVTDGSISNIGDPMFIADEYDLQNAKEVRTSDSIRNNSSSAEIVDLRIKNYKEKGYEPKDNIHLEIIVRSKDAIEAYVGLQFTNKDGKLISGVTSQHQVTSHKIQPRKTYTYEFNFPTKQLSVGVFSIDGVIYEIGRVEPIFYQRLMANFKTTGPGRGWGEFTLEGKWKSNVDT